MPKPSKPFAEIGSLKVKTFGTGSNRVKVVLFPGHEYGIEHFAPQNLTTASSPVVSLGSRSRFVQSIGGTRFIAKHTRPVGRMAPQLSAISEARLARHINGLNIPWVKIEEPLAAIFRPSGRSEVVYRLINPQGNLIPDALWFRAKKELHKRGIYPSDLTGNVFEDKDGFHFFDLEKWEVSEELRKKLRLRLAPKNVERE